MKYSLAALAILATPVCADTFHLSIGHTGGDVAVMEMESQYTAILTYENTDAQLSVQGDWQVSTKDLSCTLHVTVTAGHEKARPTCPEGWVVEPRQKFVADGESATFVISWSAF